MAHSNGNQKERSRFGVKTYVLGAAGCFLLVTLLVWCVLPPQARARFWLWTYEKHLVSQPLFVRQLIRMGAECEETVLEWAKTARPVDKDFCAHSLKYMPGSRLWLESQVMAIEAGFCGQDFAYRGTWSDAPRFIALLEHPDVNVAWTAILALQFLYIPKSTDMECDEVLFKRFIVGNAELPTATGVSVVTREQRRQALQRLAASRVLKETVREVAERAVEYLDAASLVENALDVRRAMERREASEAERKALASNLAEVASTLTGLPLVVAEMRGANAPLEVEPRHGVSERLLRGLLYHAAWCDAWHLLKILREGDNSEKLVAIWLLQRMHIPSDWEEIRSSERAEMSFLYYHMGPAAFTDERRNALAATAQLEDNPPEVRAAARRAVLRIDSYSQVRRIARTRRWIQDATDKDRRDCVRELMEMADSITGLKLKLAEGPPAGTELKGTRDLEKAGNTGTVDESGHRTEK